MQKVGGLLGGAFQSFIRAAHKYQHIYSRNRCNIKTVPVRIESDLSSFTRVSLTSHIIMHYNAPAAFERLIESMPRVLS